MSFVIGNAYNLYTNSMSSTVWKCPLILRPQAPMALRGRTKRLALCPCSPPGPCPSFQHSEQYGSSSQPMQMSVASLLQIPSPVNCIQNDRWAAAYNTN